MATQAQRKPKPKPKADTPARPPMIIVYDTATARPGQPTPPPTVVTPPPPKMQGSYMIVYDTAAAPRKRGMDALPPPARPPGTPPPSAPDTVRYVRPGVKKPEPKAPPVTIIREAAECSCITMEPGTSDTLTYETYMRYTMRMKNNCTQPVWVLSGGFSFVVLNMSGTKPRVLHRLSFVTRYQYPEFVLLEPGNTFDFTYADDPFFEYEMFKGLDYRIRFTYSNAKCIKPGGGFRTLTCIKTADRVVHVE